MKEESQTPLSEYACKLNSALFGPKLIFLITTIVSFFVGIIGAGITKSTAFEFVPMPYLLQLAWVIGLPVATNTVTSLIYFPFLYREYKTRRNKILKDNEDDHYRAQGLKAVLDDMKQLNPADLENCPMITEQIIPGQWVPFRVEHCLSYSTRSSLASDFGTVVPQLFESSSIVFCHEQNNPRKTLRVLIPSPSVIKDRLIRTIKSSKTPVKFGYELKRDHTDQVIDQFSVEDEQFLEPLIHPDMVDSIDASCQQDLNQRPILTIKAIEHEKLLRKGVAIASSIALDNGPEAVFFPSGFFTILGRRLLPYLGGEFEKTPALGSIGINATAKQLTTTTPQNNSENYKLEDFSRILLFQPETSSKSS